MDIARASAAVSSEFVRSLYYIRTPPPSRKMTRDMIDIMGSSGLAWHQWKSMGPVVGSARKSILRNHERPIVPSPSQNF